MVELTNKRTSYDITNVSDELTLRGNCQIGENLIESFTGTFNDTSGNYIGGFFFKEDSSNKITKNLSEVNTDILETACKFLDQTVTEIKDKFEQ